MLASGAIALWFFLSLVSGKDKNSMEELWQCYKDRILPTLLLTEPDFFIARLTLNDLREFDKFPIISANYDTMITDFDYSEVSISDFSTFKGVPTITNRFSGTELRVYYLHKGKMVNPGKILLPNFKAHAIAFNYNQRSGKFVFQVSNSSNNKMLEYYTIEPLSDNKCFIDQAHHLTYPNNIDFKKLAIRNDNEVIGLSAQGELHRIIENTAPLLIEEEIFKIGDLRKILIFAYHKNRPNQILFLDTTGIINRALLNSVKDKGGKFKPIARVHFPENYHIQDINDPRIKKHVFVWDGKTAKLSLVVERIETSTMTHDISGQQQTSLIDIKKYDLLSAMFNT